jgi:hypothetical protein
MEEKKNIVKPTWCTYPNAEVPGWGCYSLWLGKVTGENYCKDCECHIENVKKMQEQFRQNMEAKEFLEKYSNEKLAELAKRQFPAKVADYDGIYEDLNDDARHYALEGMKMLRDEMYDEMRNADISN